MDERIKKVREHYNLTMAEFAKRIGVTVSSISLYESGSRTPSNAVLTAICREFNINYEWLNNGDGEMIAKRQDDDAQLQMMDMYNAASDVSDRLAEKLRTLASMDKDWWKLVDKMFEQLEQRRQGK